MFSYYWDSLFLKKDKSEWPVEKYIFNPVDIQAISNPLMSIQMSRVNVSLNPFKESVMKLFEKFNSFRTVHKIFSFVFLIFSANLIIAEQKSKDFLISLISVEPEIVSGIKRQYNIIQEGEIFYVLPRLFIQNGNPVQEKLILVSGMSKIGRAILSDCHVHVASISSQFMLMIKKGFYVSNCRTILKRKQLSCFQCRRVRKVHLKRLLGPIASANLSFHPSLNGYDTVPRTWIEHLIWNICPVAVRNHEKINFFRPGLH